MSKIISAAEHTLSAVFSKRYDFAIPSYQRPYAWTTEEAGVLFDDLHGFHQQVCGNPQEQAPYFLGSIVLIKKDADNEPHALVVDGQQRLTTLTILLSAMAAQLPKGEERSDMEKYVREPGNKIEKLEPSPRLALREQDRDFFARSVQSFDFEKLARQSAVNDAQKNIRDNGALLLRRLSDEFPKAKEDAGALSQFASTVMTRCYLVAVATPNEQSAFRIFTVLNARGLDLLPTDILKADIVGGISDNERDEYAREWERLEEMAGRSGFQNLFEHIRMIHAREKARRSLREEFKEHVLGANSTPAKMKAFIDDKLSAYTDAYRVAKGKMAYEASGDANAKCVNDSLSWLGQIDNSDWVPPAILFLKQNKGGAEYAAWFFRKLERLAAFHHICARNVNERMARYARVISALEKEHSMESPIKAIELEDGEKREMKRTLDGDIYGPFGGLRPLRRNYAILRLDSFVADAGATYDRSYLTIEHVLPQTVSDGGEWARVWPDEDLRAKWVGRIANLVPLNRKRNAAASNYGFCKKKTEYFSRGATPYVLTAQVLSKNEWTPGIVEERQKELLRFYAEGWELD